jgi:hypothetical protein
VQPSQATLSEGQAQSTSAKEGGSPAASPALPQNLHCEDLEMQKLEVLIICGCAGAYQQVCLGQLLEAGDEVSIPGYSIVSICPSLSQAGELQTQKETLVRH